MARRRMGVIGGTGFYRWAAGTETLEVETPYGVVDVEYERDGHHEFFFLPRHGALHQVPPHRVNHRAQIAAMRAVKPDYVLGVFNVGAVRPDLRAGTWVLLSDFIDLRHAPTSTFHDDEAVHVDMGQPYCPTARAALASTAPRGTAAEAVYGAVPGPRFDSAAETRMMGTLGVDVVGMTGVPEVTLAREAGLCYAGIALVANDAPGKGIIEAAQVQSALARRAGRARDWARRFLGSVPTSKRCRCAARAKAGRLEVAA